MANSRPPKTTKASVSATTHDALLDAAEEILLERSGGLTLEAIAARAKISKGGLLYHFRSKDALIVAMVTRLTDGVASEFRSHLGEGTPEPGRSIHAFMRTTWCDSGTAAYRRLNRLSTALLAVTSDNVRLIKPVQRFYAEVFVAIRADGGDLGRAFLMLAAADGLWLGQLLGLYTLSTMEEKAVANAAEKLLSFSAR